jgi:glutaredoxin
MNAILASTSAASLRRLALVSAAVATLGVVAGGCRSRDKEGLDVERIALEQAPPAPPIGDAPGPWTLRYFDPASGELKAARAIADVPAAGRAQVLVSYDDPALQGAWIYVADLSQKQGDRYPVRALPRAEIEAQRAAATAARRAQPAAATGSAAGQGRVAGSAAASASEPAAAADRDVIIYRTAWCGYCKKAAEYLRLKGVAFAEKDIEADPGAREDMLRRARAAGFPAERLQGVPILSVRGRIIPGFDRGAIDRALGS